MYLIGQMRISVQAERGELQLAGEGAAVERFDIDQLVDELVGTGVDLAVGQAMEHERIVRIRAMADANELFGHE